MSTFIQQQILRNLYRQRENNLTNMENSYGRNKESRELRRERATEEAKETFKKAIPELAQDVKDIEAALNNNTGEILRFFMLD